MQAIEDDEPIYGLAVECERLFVQQISSLNDEDQPNGAKVLSELSQRFAAWTAFLGVFAASNVCLDSRLRRHVEIQDQVLRLLDIMQRNLAYLFERNDSPDHIDPGSSNARQSSLHLPCVSIDSLDAISGAIERLNHLGISIRHSSVKSQTIKAREFAETFDLASFEGVAYRSVRTLYPDISEDLLEQLTRSMTETYSRFLRRKYRQEQLQAPRSCRRAAIPLSTITEEPVGDADMGSPMDTHTQVRQAAEGFTKMLQRRSGHILPMSEPTSVDSQEVKRRFEKMLSPATNNKTVSIVVSQVDYPPPAKGSLACEWCFSPLPTDTFEEVKWRRHVNEDFEPYVCISEDCSESLMRFATSIQWLEHMLTTHGKSWHREVHLPPSWACPLCGDEPVTFSRPEDLTEHLEDLHAGTFTISQVQAIVRQSRFRSLRRQDVCPLCCLPVKGTQDPLSKKTGNDNGSDLQTTNKHREPRVLFGSSSSNSSGLEVMASHVAAHLQGIMLLTLRLISIDVEMDVSADHQSASGSTHDQSSLIGSSERALYQEMDGTEDFSLNGDGEIDTDNDSPLEHSIAPDCENMDWSVVPRRYEAPPESGVKDIIDDGVDSQQSGDQCYLGRDLEEFISKYPTGKPCDKDYLGEDLEEFVSSPPMGAPRDRNHLGWELEKFISNPPTGTARDKHYLGQDLEQFISDGPV